MTKEASMETMTQDEEAEVLAVLEAVGATLTATSEHDEPFSVYYSGDYTWTLSNGWRVTVFNDCDEWDYIDRIETSDGRAWDFPYEPSAPAMTDKVAYWQPKNCAAWGDVSL